MNSSVLLRGVSAGALTLLVSHEAFAQQSLPTIDVGGARRAPPSRISVPPSGRPSTPAPGPSSRFPSEPKTPEQGYVVSNATTGMKLNIPIKETPASIAVVPKQVLVDQNITRLQDALENVSGVQSNNNDLEGYIFNIRGFQSLYIYRNALAIPGGEANPQIFDTANIERIEVLKGPASILFGRSEPGGIINIITKQPLDKPRYVAEQQVGSYNYYRTQWDFSAPSETIPGLAARVTGAYQNSGSFRKFQGGNRIIIAPVVSYRPSDWTEFTVDTQFLTNRTQSDIGQPSLGPYGNLPGPLPNNRSFQEPNDPRDRNDSYNISYNFRQNLSEDWKVTNRFLYTEGWLGKPLISGLTVQPDNLTFDRVTQFQDLHGRTFSTNLDFNGKFETFGAQHNFLFGLDYLISLYDYFFGNGLDIYPIGLYAPIYGTVPSFAYWGAIVGSGFKGHSSVLTRQKGMYVQDYITVLDRVHVLMGVRYDVADVTRGAVSSNYDTGNIADVLAPSKNLAIADRLASPTNLFTGWTPRAGVVFDISPELSGYGSYSRSFGLNNGFDAQNRALPPEKGLQWEVGLKAQVLQDVLATLAFFQITKSGVSTQDFLNIGASRLAGLQRSRGVELDVVGRVSERVAIIANYAHIDAKVIDDSPVNRLNPFGALDRDIYGPRSGLLGNHLQIVPRHSGKIALTYDFGENGLGFRVGASVTAQTRSWGDVQNTFLLPGRARLDGFASYATLFEGHKLTAQLNLKNINNVHYFQAVDNFFNYNVAPYLRTPAPPFTAVGTLRFEW
ncbi:MAG: TonB-dependent siderophore receptor [Methylocystis sp.]